MFLTSLVILLLCFFGGRIHCESSMETESVNVTQTCSPTQTDCAFGCCPFEDGVCCLDGFECCEHGQTCIPFIGVCVGAVNNNGEISLTSKKSTSVRSSVLKCPPGMLECGLDKCCIYPGGVCCYDGQHCCPKGFKCDVPGEKCIPDTTNEKIGRDFYSTAALDKPLTKLNRKSPYKHCPEGGRICPSYMSCCVNDDGKWGCCPNPSRPEIQYGNGECCDSIFGHFCCPNSHPLCTLLGCL